MKNEQGYIALMVVLLIASMVVVIGLSTSLLSINDLMSSFAGHKNEEAINLTESCVEDVLVRLNENGSIPASVTIPGATGGTCTVTSNSQVGSTWDFTVSSGVDYVKRIRIVATRGTNVIVTSWLEQ